MEMMENSPSLAMDNRSVAILLILLQVETIGALCSQHTSPRVELFIPASGLVLGCLLISAEVVLAILMDPISKSPISEYLVLLFRVQNRQNVALWHPRMPQQ